MVKGGCMHKLRKLCYFVSNCIYNPQWQKVLKIMAALCLISCTTHAFASDLLNGTETDLMDTLNGTGKKYLYIAECLVSLLVYIKTKNVLVLIGIMVVAIFFNIMIKMAG